mmetsp:Transcript_36678/g.88378  ORF Transcript_36678/g.88378 Transcript_36678/m.88378 type:complete len:124 (+) Transcript_36678:644-1015(+)
MSHSSVKVRPTQLFITITSQNINVPAFANVQQTDIQGSTAKIVYHDIVHIIAFVESICQCRSCGLLQDTRHLETCHFECADGRVTLRWFKFGRYGNYGRLDVVVLEMVPRQSAEVMNDVGAYF